MMETADFLSRLKGVKPNGDNGWLALCPGHDDHEQSLSIKEVAGKILVHDFGGCEPADILKPLGLQPKDLFLDGKGGGGGVPPAVNPVNVSTPTQKQARNTVDTPKTNGVNGVTLAGLAEAKHLSVDFLKSLGISDFKYSGQPAVKIPYYAEDGTEQAVRFRLSLTAGDGSRFKWRKGSHAMPYGLNRLDKIRKAGWVLIVEGESDCWTCWYHDIPAIGAPGKSVWPPAWGEYLEGLEVYVWQEPEAEDFTLRVLRTAPSLRFIKAPKGTKDISKAHVQGLDIPAWLEEQKANAEYGQALKARSANERLAQAYSEARRVIEAEDPLELVKEAIRGLGYGGDLNPALIAYLAATSRLLAMRDGAMPVHLLLTGLSSVGKNYTLSRILILLPTEAYHVIDAGSPRVLIYDDAPLENKVLVFTEADSLPAGEDNPAASAIRNLLQDHFLHYEVTVRHPITGDYIVRKIAKPGPTVLITTSTRSLGAQLMTRLFTLEIADSKEQITAALVTQATLETEGLKSVDSGLIAFQLYLQLKAPFKVVVPYAKELGVAMAQMASAPRILRDFARLISLIKSVALIRHHHRQVDCQGRIMATLADYRLVRELVNDMYVDSSTGATSDVRKLVEAVIAFNASRTEGERTTNTAVAKRLDIGIKQAERRAKKAIKLGWLVNREQRKYHPADYAPGEPLPDIEGLPILEVDTVDIVDNERVQEFSFENKGVDTLTPLTVDDTPPTTDSLEFVLGMPVADAIEVWRSEGAPIIYLGPGENCFDLEKLLSNRDAKPEHLETVRKWLEKVSVVSGVSGPAAGSQCSEDDEWREI
jgi:hypothetical protein